MKEYHGASKSPTYNTYRSMIDRCYKQKHASFKYYGAQGITVCASWRKSYHSFVDDMGERPLDTQLDREDNEGNYNKENCRWVTCKTNARNRRSNRELTYKGETLCLSAWAERTGLEKATIRMRLERGWSAERTLTEPLVDCRKPITFQGICLSMTEWAARLGMTKDVLHKRLTSGNMTVAKALSTPYKKRPHIQITHNGVTKKLHEWASQLGIKPAVLRNRINRGWSTERALTTP